MNAHRLALALLPLLLSPVSLGRPLCALGVLAWVLPEAPTGSFAANGALLAAQEQTKPAPDRANPPATDPPYIPPAQPPQYIPHAQPPMYLPPAREPVTIPRPDERGKANPEADPPRQEKKR